MFRFPCGQFFALRRISTATVPTAPVSASVSATGSRKKTEKPPVLPIRDALGRIQSQQPSVYAKLLIHNFPFSVVRTDFIVTHRMPDVQVGDVITLDEVREVGSARYKLRGLPLLPGGAVKVTATVMEHSNGLKQRARTRKQRKGRRAMRTIKPRTTTLRVQDIVIDPNFQN
ncbi:Aconitate hydratase [Paramicrosporidium saccamoebae]|uniref:Large ribosomal subunit protein bL21m n=1 Tax=Paramicrosporidium saccamoebae TaxID=1246581 RepID=A0A2H9TQN8_9FUNG|nr:Aconitate hydratase [Paramicrosporidium saccamoebae]